MGMGDEAFLIAGPGLAEFRSDRFGLFNSMLGFDLWKQARLVVRIQ